MTEAGHSLGRAQRCRGLREEVRLTSEVRREALLREEGRDPAKRCDRVVTLLPRGDAIDEIPVTKDGIVDVPLLRVGSNEAVGGLDLQPEEFVATAEPHAVGQ